MSRVSVLYTYKTSLVFRLIYLQWALRASTELIINVICSYNMPRFHLLCVLKRRTFKQTMRSAAQYVTIHHVITLAPGCLWMEAGGLYTARAPSASLAPLTLQCARGGIKVAYAVKDNMTKISIANLIIGASHIPRQRRVSCSFLSLSSHPPHSIGAWCVIVCQFWFSCLKGNWGENSIWPENVENVQIFTSACFV